ncbi:MAG: hypothetical protein ACRBF0_11810 [Calditrichia bacterium]
MPLNYDSESKPKRGGKIKPPDDQEDRPTRRGNDEDKDEDQDKDQE